MPFDTPLKPDEETQFQTWKGIHAPQDSGMDYDFRGAWKAGLQPGADGHWRDTYKKPNHPTFSDESIYSSLTGTKPGSWQGPNRDQYVPFGGKMIDPVDTVRVGMQALDMGKMSEAGFDINAHHQRMLTTGPFADAAKRQSVWDRVNDPSMPFDHEQGPGYPDEGDGHHPKPQLMAGNVAPMFGSNPNGKKNALGHETQRQLQALDEDAANPLREATSNAVMAPDAADKFRPLQPADAMNKHLADVNAQKDKIEKRFMESQNQTYMNSMGQASGNWQQPGDFGSSAASKLLAPETQAQKRARLKAAGIEY